MKATQESYKMSSNIETTVRGHSPTVQSAFYFRLWGSDSTFKVWNHCGLSGLFSSVLYTVIAFVINLNVLQFVTRLCQSEWPVKISLTLLCVRRRKGCFIQECFPESTCTVCKCRIHLYFASVLFSYLIWSQSFFLLVFETILLHAN